MNEEQNLTELELDLLECLQWMVDAHESGLLICRSGTAGDREFHNKRLAAAREVIAEAKARLKHDDSL